MAVIVLPGDISLHGAELWLYDPMEVGLAYDLNPGSASSSPANFVVFNNLLYFSANDGVNGTELWKYDGTNTPVRVTQICPGSGSSNPANPCVYNNALYFSANDGSSGAELWKYDGTNATRVADIVPGSGGSSPASLTVFNGTLYFVAQDTNSVRALWKYNGSAVSLVTNVNTGSASSFPYDGIAFNGAYYFAALRRITPHRTTISTNMTAPTSAWSAPASIRPAAAASLLSTAPCISRPGNLTAPISRRSVEIHCRATTVPWPFSTMRFILMAGTIPTETNYGNVMAQT